MPIIKFVDEISFITALENFLLTEMPGIAEINFEKSTETVNNPTSEGNNNGQILDLQLASSLPSYGILQMIVVSFHPNSQYS